MSLFGSLFGGYPLQMSQTHLSADRRSLLQNSDRQSALILARRRAAENARLIDLARKYGLGAVPSANGLGFLATQPPLPTPDPVEQLPGESKFGEIMAWKMFSVSTDYEGNLSLHSPYRRGAIWVPQQVFEADAKPGETHSHGVYAWKSRDDAAGREALGQVLVQVMLWGDVMEHEHGYRAQFCRVFRVHRPEPDSPYYNARGVTAKQVREIAKRYNYTRKETA